MKRQAPNLRQLTRTAHALRLENQELRQNVELRNQQMQNSLYTLVQAAGAQTQMGSFNNLAYYNIYSPLTINWTLLTYMYKTHGIIQAMVDMPVLDALRGGLDLHSDQLSPDDLKDLHDRMERDGILSTISEAAIWTRLYGGGGIIINTDQDPEQPLDLKRVKEFELYAANRWELVAPNRFAEFYEFYGERLHKSRVITMSGKAAPYIIRWTLQGWGMSEMERIVEDFNTYLQTNGVLYELLKEAKIDVYQFEGLTAQLASSAGTRMTQERVELMNKLKNFQNAIVLDMKDKFEQKQITFAGIAEIMKQNQIRIATATRIPMTKLFGLSASGFNSGEDDIENYNAMVESEVRTPLRPVLRTVIDMLVAMEFGDSFDIAFDYKPLRVMSSIDEENVKTQKHARYSDDYSRGILNDQEYAGLLQSEKLLPIETEVSKGAAAQPPEQGLDDSEPGDDTDTAVDKKTKKDAEGNGGPA